MSVTIFKCCEGHQHARAVGCSLSLGYWPVDEREELRKQLNFSIGIWWWVFQWQIWREP